MKTFSLPIGCIGPCFWPSPFSKFQFSVYAQPNSPLITNQSIPTHKIARQMQDKSKTICLFVLEFIIRVTLHCHNSDGLLTSSMIVCLCYANDFPSKYSRDGIKSFFSILTFFFRFFFRFFFGFYFGICISDFLTGCYDHESICRSSCPEFLRPIFLIIFAILPTFHK